MVGYRQGLPGCTVETTASGCLCIDFPLPNGRKISIVSAASKEPTLWMGTPGTQFVNGVWDMQTEFSQKFDHVADALAKMIELVGIEMSK